MVWLEYSALLEIVTVAIEWSTLAFVPVNWPTIPPIAYWEVVTKVFVILPVKLLLLTVEFSTFWTSPPIPNSPAMIPFAWTFSKVEEFVASLATDATWFLPEILTSFKVRSLTVACSNLLNNGFFKL